MSAEIIRPSAAMVQISGDILWQDHPALEAALNGAAASEAGELIVDMSGVTFAFSSAVALLIEAGRKAGAIGKSVVYLVPARLTWLAKYLEQAGQSHGFTVRIV